MTLDRFRDGAQGALARARAWNDPSLFIATDATATGGDGPLAGVPIAVKDNIDVAGLATTAACPSYAYLPAEDAAVVARLRAAGAVPMAKANLDQFATGLVGVRSPYGVPRNPFDAALIPGGSSSGSACAVAAGIVPAALGTDTAGSGRVPAACTGIIGLKPTRGLLSTRGVVPAVRSLDCVSIFARTVADAWTVLGHAAGFDPLDPFSRRAGEPVLPMGAVRVGVPGDEDLEGIVEPSLLACYRQALGLLRDLGHELVAIDYGPFRAAADLLYGGAWVAERTAAVGDFLAGDPAGADPTVAAIIGGGRRHDAVGAHRGAYELARLAREAEAQWARCDVLALPTISEHPTVAAVRADPVGVNSRLGRFTNFANLLDTCALALPAGLRPGGLPAGFTLFAPAWHDALVCRIGAAFQSRLALPLGATGSPCPREQALPGLETGIAVAVFGAHLRGQPLHQRMLALGGRFAGECRTAPLYRCHLIPGAMPRPGLVRVAEGGGALMGEIYHLPAAGFGRLVGEVMPPLAIGTVVLDDGRELKGYLCEAAMAAGTPDITAHGGWRAYRAAVGAA
jgi:allophanate hydrolase